jgi:predicted small secreted protein
MKGLEMKMLKQVILCLLLAISGVTLFSGCHTAHGFGEDMESAGESIKDKTDR